LERFRGAFRKSEIAEKWRPDVPVLKGDFFVASRKQTKIKDFGKTIVDKGLGGAS